MLRDAEGSSGRHLATALSVRLRWEQQTIFQRAHYRGNRGFCGENSLQGKILGKMGKSRPNQGILQKHVREISGNFQHFIS